MTTIASLPAEPRDAPRALAGAEAVSWALLADVGTRWPHVRTAGMVAGRLSALFGTEEAELLVAAATTHDIGYSPRIARTGCHSLDGGLYLRAQGFPERMASLVAHHSLAYLTAGMRGVRDLDGLFVREESLLADALVFADMHSSPDGRLVPADERLADIARRHTHPRVALRDSLLRASIARVERAVARKGLPPVLPVLTEGRPRAAAPLAAGATGAG